jgi:hypothetical protein
MYNKKGKALHLKLENNIKVYYTTSSGEYSQLLEKPNSYRIIKENKKSYVIEYKDKTYGRIHKEDLKEDQIIRKKLARIIRLTNLKDVRVYWKDTSAIMDLLKSESAKVISDNIKSFTIVWPSYLQTTCRVLKKDLTEDNYIRHPEIIRPNWIEPKEMKKIGYQLISDKDGYLKYENVAGHIFPSYGKSCRGKRIIYFNTTDAIFERDTIDTENMIFMGIKEDADTRTVYNGVVNSKELLISILNYV